MTNLMNRKFPNRFTLSNFVDDFEKHMYNIADSFFTCSSISDLKNKMKSNTGYPKLDVFVNKDNYVIQASVPGVKPEDLTIEIQEENGIRYAKISGKMSEEYSFKDDDTNWQTKELCRRAFQRVVAIPENITGDPDAMIKDGIMSLTWGLPKELKQVSSTKVIELKKG